MNTLATGYLSFRRNMDSYVKNHSISGPLLWSRFLVYPFSGLRRAGDRYLVNEIFYSCRGKGARRTPNLFLRMRVQPRLQVGDTRFDCDTEFESGAG